MKSNQKETKERDIIYIPFFEIEIIFNKKEYKYFVNGLNGIVFGKNIEYINKKETKPYLLSFTIAFFLFVIVNYFFDHSVLVIGSNLLILYVFYNITVYIINSKGKRE